MPICHTSALKVSVIHSNEQEQDREHERLIFLTQIIVDMEI